MEGAASQGEQKRPDLLHYIGGYSTADVCVLQRPEAVLRHVQEVHGKAVEKNIGFDGTPIRLLCAGRAKEEVSPKRKATP